MIRVLRRYVRPCWYWLKMMYHIFACVTLPLLLQKCRRRYRVTKK